MLLSLMSHSMLAAAAVADDFEHILKNSIKLINININININLDYSYYLTYIFKCSLNRLIGYGL